MSISVHEMGFVGGEPDLEYLDLGEEAAAAVIFDLVIYGRDLARLLGKQLRVLPKILPKVPSSKLLNLLEDSSIPTEVRKSAHQLVDDLLLDEGYEGRFRLEGMEWEPDLGEYSSTKVTGSDEITFKDIEVAFLIEA